MHIRSASTSGAVKSTESCALALWQGYIFGGVVAGPLGWRAAFLLEAAAMAPFVAFCALAPPIHLRGMSKGALPLSSSSL